MIKYGKAICYSGYRENQDPRKQIYPTDEEVLYDLRILEKHFQYIRMYDVYEHARTVLRVIRKNQLSLKLMLGVEPRGEISNPNCPWGGLHSDEEIEFNKDFNYRQLDDLIQLANEYKDVIFAVSVGNENTSDWHHNLMDPHTMANHVKYIKAKVEQPVTFCEGAHYWHELGEEIAQNVDFLSIHSYPLWQRVSVEKALQMNIDDYDMNKKKYPNKQIIFTEFGWATMSNDSMDKTQTNEETQCEYLNSVEKWSEENEVVMFVFEAFDEPWKGSNDPIEPEKHWGIYNVDRTPKKWMKQKSE